MPERFGATVEKVVFRAVMLQFADSNTSKIERENSEYGMDDKSLSIRLVDDITLVTDQLAILLSRRPARATTQLQKTVKPQERWFAILQVQLVKPCGLRTDR